MVESKKALPKDTRPNFFAHYPNGFSSGKNKKKLFLCKF